MSNEKWTGPVGRLYSPKEIEANGGPRHSKLYELIRRGALEAVKDGSLTKITGRSWESYKDSLPRVLPKTAA
jgi:hypothetical protein